MNCALPLEPTGGVVALFSPAGQRVDAVSFGFQIPGRSLGRDGDGAWQLLQTPTPGAANAPPAALGPASALRFNEWMARPLEGEDWFELYNTADLPVALGGLWLTDSPALPERAKHRIAPLSFIAPRAWVLWWASGRPDRGPYHADFNLDAEGETLRLYDAAFRLLDAVDFGRQDPGVSEGRLPDGSDRLERFPDRATPGTANGRADPDRDGDGLPDAWEQAHGTDSLTPDAAADPDGDGATNLEEYRAGTDPRDAASALRLELVLTGSERIELRFVARPDRTYRLESTGDLAAEPWTLVHLEPGGALTRPVTVSQTLGAARRFYRVLLPASGPP